MNPWVPTLAMCIAATTSPGAQPGESTLRPTALRCEARVDPLGIGERRPRLSWKVAALDPRRRGLRQSAYRILVAASEEGLARDEGDLWDSGEVRSNATIGIEYAGRALTSRRRCWWKVRVWDQDGQASAWSPAATWSMGLLEPGDWRGRWIGFDAPLAEREPGFTLEGAQWIWHPAAPPLKAPAGTRFFRARWNLPADIGMRSATLEIDADDVLEVHINGQLVPLRWRERTSYKHVAVLDVAHLLGVGPNLIAAEVRNTAPGTAGLIAKLVVVSHEGSVFTQVSDGSWRCAERAEKGWMQVGFDDSAWLPARVLAPYGKGPWGSPEIRALHLPPPRYLRRGFEASREIRRATLYGSALGIYELRLNGQRIGEDYFTPGWSDYTKRVYYNTYDVTARIRRGTNALAAVLADGWFAGYIGYGNAREHYGAKTRLRAQLELEYTDGTREIVASDASWKASQGPLRQADFLMGELYDGRRAMAGWDEPGFDDERWQPVDLGAELAPALQPYPARTVGVIATLVPTLLGQPRPGAWVFDMGQNFAGVVRLKVRAEAGRRITLRHAERLNPDGTIYTDNLRSARATDTYVCRGTGQEEVWQPRFTFHGFQYVEVSGLPGEPQPDTVLGLALGSRTPVTGNFECSDPMLNQLVSNIYWTQRMNFIDIPTDCPQRDERLGWTGDAQIYVRTAAMICDVQSFFTKWLVDLADAQRADGQFPMVAPLKVAGGDGGPAWADAGTICPWTIYDVYGDRRLLERHYEGMQRYIAFCEGRCTKKLLPPKKFHCFGDWVSIRSKTPKDVIFTAYFAHSAHLTALAAAALGKEAEAARYEQLCERIKAAFAEAYIDPKGRIKGNTQTGYVLALAFDLVSGERREQAAAHLIERIAARDGHLSTGFIGTKDLMLALSKIGRTDIAYQLLHNTTFPSWGFSIRNGATTIWERWNGWTPEEGFATPGMNSFAHYAFGAVGQWIFENTGGIDNLAPGFARILIRPRLDERLSWARAGFESIHGAIACEWRRTGDALEMLVTIPPNTTARIHVPASSPAAVRERGGPAADAPGLELVGMEAGAAVFEAASGSYSFRVR